jgi:hypothetical protein
MQCEIGLINKVTLAVLVKSPEASFWESANFGIDDGYHIKNSERIP